MSSVMGISSWPLTFPVQESTYLLTEPHTKIKLINFPIKIKSKQSKYDVMKMKHAMNMKADIKLTNLNRVSF